LASYDWIEIGKKNMTCTKRSEKSSGPISVILMLANLLAMLVAISMIYFLPIQVALIVGAVLYGGLLLLEWCAGIRAPVVPLVFTIYLLLIIGYYTTDSNEWLPYTGTIFYAALFTLLAVLLLFKKPFTLFYSEKGLMSLHYVTAWMWMVIYLMAALASFLLMPDITFIYVPFLLLLVGTIATLVINFWYFGPFHTRKRDFTLNNFRFSEVDEEKKKELEAFYTTVTTEFWTSIAKYPKRKVASKDELKHILMVSDAKYQGHITRFIAFFDKQPVGAICCYHDTSKKGLPFEPELNLDFDKLRRLGKVMEIGRFSIHGKHRLKQDVFLGLLKCVIELAMERDVAFLGNSTFTHMASFYQKIGFVDVGSGLYFSQVYGADSRPLVMNLSRTIVYEDERSAGAVARLVPLLNEFVAERSYKRAIIRALFRRRTSRSHEQANEILRKYFT